MVQLLPSCAEAFRKSWIQLTGSHYLSPITGRIWRLSAHRQGILRRSWFFTSISFDTVKPIPWHNSDISCGSCQQLVCIWQHCLSSSLLRTFVKSGRSRTLNTGHSESAKVGGLGGGVNLWMATLSQHRRGWMPQTLL